MVRISRVFKAPGRQRDKKWLFACGWHLEAKCLDSFSAGGFWFVFQAYLLIMMPEIITLTLMCNLLFPRSCSQHFCVYFTGRKKMVKSAGQVKAARKSWSLNSEYMFLTAAPHSLLSFSLPKSIWEKKSKRVGVASSSRSPGCPVGSFTHSPFPLLIHPHILPFISPIPQILVWIQSIRLSSRFQR